MLRLVWIDDWQMQCCGAPFRVGGAIEAISCRWEHRDGAMQLVPGTTQAVLRHEATGREPEDGDVAFVGYVVKLQTEATAGISPVLTDCEDGS